MCGHKVKESRSGKGFENVCDICMKRIRVDLSNNKKEKNLELLEQEVKNNE